MVGGWVGEGGEECTDGVWLVGGDGSVGGRKKKREREGEKNWTASDLQKAACLLR